MGLMAQYVFGPARTRWAHCCDCGVKLDYQVGSIIWNSMKRGYGANRCGGCQGKKDADEIFASLRERLRAISQVRSSDREAKHG